MTVCFSIIDNDETADESPQAKSGHHPHFDRAVMRSRRKSVSFAVYKVNADTMQFDIEHKSVLLGNLSGRVRLAFDSLGLDTYHRGLSTLAKYHREAAGLQIFFFIIQIYFHALLFI